MNIFFPEILQNPLYNPLIDKFCLQSYLKRLQLKRRLPNIITTTFPFPRFTHCIVLYICISMGYINCIERVYKTSVSDFKMKERNKI